MKKTLITFIAFSLTLTLNSSVMAGTMGVNVSPGYSVQVEKDSGSGDNWEVTGNFGLNDRLLLNASYTFAADAVYFGGRYEFADNQAVVFGYKMFDDGNMFTLGLRGKTPLTSDLNLTGDLSYLISRNNALGETDVSWEYTLQFEEKFGDKWAGNLGATFDLTDGDSTVNGIVGAEIYLSKVTLYFDYYIYPDNGDNLLTIGIEAGF